MESLITRRRRIAVIAVAVLTVATITAICAGGGVEAVAAAFRAGDYAAARQAAAALDPGGADSGEVQLWQQRLSTDPVVAAELARQIVRNRSVPLARRIQAALDGASLALASQRPEESWRLLQPLLEQPGVSLPGEVYLLAGQTLRQAGDRQRAREMLASVRPEDPAFVAARNLLGRIGLESGDHELALRYFESATRGQEEGEPPEVMAGRWQVLRLLGRDIEARELAARLLRHHPGSLAALELSDLQRRDELELAAAREQDAPPPSPPADPTADGGRFTVQLASFRDRALALQFVTRWRTEIPDLRVAPGQDALDQPLHRIQVGSYLSRMQAATELQRLQRQFGLEGFVTESGD